MPTTTTRYGRKIQLPQRFLEEQIRPRTPPNDDHHEMVLISSVLEPEVEPRTYNQAR